ncbi:hypothetical protein F4810DRAFT_219078 [Camillea tinctor]|nr:hypothetical protein F4810DRAFT_219078 [Camillea tinctor]
MNILDDSSPQPSEQGHKSATLQNGSSSLAELETAEILHSIRHPSANPTSVQPPSDLALSLDIQEPSSPSLSSSYDPASYYWDASTMAPLSAVSAAAIARLRAYKPPPFPTWDRLPVSRRAAVLILLFADRRGDLRVVITMRAASLRNFSGHAAFPGGKADSLQETPYQIARREAWEEIGLPMNDDKIPKPFRIEPLCCLPCSLAKTELAVRPCVAFLHSDDSPGRLPAPTADEGMMPRLDAKEVAAVFSGPFHNFLRVADESPPMYDPEAPEATVLPDGDWYDGFWSRWHGEPWRVHNFHVPINNQRVTRPRVREGGQAAISDDPDEEDGEAGRDRAAAAQRFLVWGLTGRMLVDAARIAYAEEPEFEHNAHYGDEHIISRLERDGRLPEKKRKEVGLEATKEEVKDARI